MNENANAVQHKEPGSNEPTKMMPSLKSLLLDIPFLDIPLLEISLEIHNRLVIMLTLGAL